ncbi:MAG: hypothetical protein KDE31_25205, partial [Caldilineaceae bacterium]|nr:hypothetical protein [Caldilineaceae bacterium]
SAYRQHRRHDNSRAASFLVPERVIFPRTPHQRRETIRCNVVSLRRGALQFSESELMLKTV